MRPSAMQLGAPPASPDRSYWFAVGILGIAAVVMAAWAHNRMREPKLEARTRDRLAPRILLVAAE
jgi:hypothetical protein